MLRSMGWVSEDVVQWSYLQRWSPAARLNAVKVIARHSGQSTAWPDSDLRQMPRSMSTAEEDAANWTLLYRRVAAGCANTLLQQRGVGAGRYLRKSRCRISDLSLSFERTILALSIMSVICYKSFCKWDWNKNLLVNTWLMRIPTRS